MCKTAALRLSALKKNTAVSVGMSFKSSRSQFHNVRKVQDMICRCYSTSYTAKVTSASSTGRVLSAEVSPQNPLDPRGYALPRRHLICKVTQLLRQSDDDACRPSSTRPKLNPFLQLEDYFSSLSLTLTSDEACEIMKSLNSPSLAMKFFRLCPSLCPKFRHNCFTYTRLVLIISRSNLPDKLELVRGMLSEMEKNGVRGSISTVNILIGCFGEGKDLERCIELLKKWDLEMTAYTYKCLVQAYLRSHDSEKGFRVYEKMKSEGYKLDIFAYNMLLNALTNDNKINLACLVFEDMKRNHCAPDEYTYTIMIKLSGKTGKHDRALAFFEEMLNKGYFPNVVVYNTMLQALTNSRMVDKAILLFSKMVETGCRPNEYTYHLLLNLLAAVGKLHKLDNIVEVSKKYMTRSIYAYLVRTLSKLGYASEAHRFFCNLWNFHDRGDKDACISMLESLCSAGKTAEAIDLLSKLHEKGVDTDTMMYNMVLSALGKSKEIHHLHDIYESMKNKGPPPDTFTYNILISSFGRVGKVDDAVRIFEELENSECVPDIISYNSLINCLGKNGDVDAAHMRFKEMREKGLNPDVVTYSTLIECFGKTEKVEMACRLFDEMLGEGCYPNIVTYNILLDCLERSGRTAEAVDLYAKLKQNGLSPDSITHAVLERLQSGSHKKFRIRKQHPITGWVVSPLR